MHLHFWLNGYLESSFRNNIYNWSFRPLNYRVGETSATHDCFWILWFYEELQGWRNSCSLLCFSLLLLWFLEFGLLLIWAWVIPADFRLRMQFWKTYSAVHIQVRAHFSATKNIILVNIVLFWYGDNPGHGLILGPSFCIPATTTFTV